MFPRESNSKRKSVSFASEVSFQAISPSPSPRKQAGSEKQEVTSPVPAPGNDGIEKGDNSTEKSKYFLAYLRTMSSRWAFVIAYCLSSIVHVCVHACNRPSVRPSVNNFFKQLLLLNHLTNCVCRDVPCMKLYQSCWKNKIPCRTLVAIATERFSF